MDHPFRNAAFGGFNRQDVMTYLEEQAKQNQQQREELERQRDEANGQCESLRQAQEDLRRQLEESRRELEDLRQERDGLTARLEEANRELSTSRTRCSQTEQELGVLPAVAPAPPPPATWR